jgi:hypothetical protein
MKLGTEFIGAFLERATAIRFQILDVLESLGIDARRLMY